MSGTFPNARHAIPLRTDRLVEACVHLLLRSESRDASESHLPCPRRGRRYRLRVNSCLHKEEVDIRSSAPLVVTLGHESQIGWQFCPSPSSILRWNVPRCDVCAPTEEMTFHLLGQVFPGARIGQAQAVFIDQH